MYEVNGYIKIPVKTLVEAKNQNEALEKAGDRPFLLNGDNKEVYEYFTNKKGYSIGQLSWDEIKNKKATRVVTL